MCYLSSNGMSNDGASPHWTVDDNKGLIAEGDPAASRFLLGAHRAVVRTRTNQMASLCFTAQPCLWGINWPFLAPPASSDLSHPAGR
ncbi:hypothetical protein C0Q70_01811 [Pomacea canaliculata]|uniref:Uncharacterized protein n=1 Tax=Pomacea canaliculata TaxID=400727 RepID=A0A2T7Q0I7_POMCA|nr:hypothetical protein C0Q70_01811 [Pomacea canaliculata]